MEWNAESIRHLRMRLGWSQADLALRIGCISGLVQSWESGKESPDVSGSDSLDRLLNQVEHYSKQLKQVPLAESAIKDGGLCQVSSQHLPDDSSS